MRPVQILLISGIILSVLLLQVECQGQKVPTDNKGQIDRDSDEVKDLLKENNLKESESFRCGVFFAGKKFKDKPVQKLFIIPKRFPINSSYAEEDSKLPKRYSNDVTCPIKNPYGTVDNPSVHNDTCFNIFINVVNKLKLEHDSFKGNPGKSIGDDTCAKLITLGIRRMPPNIRFKEGIPIGFYYNMCSDKSWYDTGLRLPQNLCCDIDKGFDDPTYLACDDQADLIKELKKKL